MSLSPLDVDLIVRGIDIESMMAVVLLGGYGSPIMVVRGWTY